MSQATFAAKRTYSSGELLALRRQQVERAQTRPPSIHLQDSSELTARVRKMAAVMPEFLPSQGNSTNMVKWRDCSVVQAMREGESYRTSATNRQVRADRNSCAQVPIPFIRPDFVVATTPKAIGCARVIEEEQRVIQPFDLAQHFGMRKNDNKGVISRYPAFVDGTCVYCRAPYRNCIPPLLIAPFSSFSSSNWTVNGNSSVSGSSIVLTPNIGGQRGSTFYNVRAIDVTRPFTITATVTLRASGTPLDPGNGFGIVLATDPSFLGSTGGSNGFFDSLQGFRAYGLVVDTFASDDSGNRNMFLINASNTYANKKSTANAWVNLTNSGASIVNTSTGGATVVLTYDGTTLTATLTSLADPTKTDTVSANVSLVSELNSTIAYFGSSSGSGSAYQLTTLTDMQFNQPGTC